jgi:cyclin A
MPETFTEGAITRAKRGMLVDWLVEVAEDFKLPADTLHLAVSYVDRFLSVGVIILSKLQLLGVAALLVAA